MNLQGLAKDKRVQVAAAAGGGLALIALLRKKSTGGGSTTATTASNGSPIAGTSGYGQTLGSYDSSGTDAYNNLQNSMDNQLAQFGNQITGIQTQLAGLSPTGTSQGGTSTTTPTLAATPIPTASPTPTVTAAPNGSTGGVPTGSINKPTIGAVTTSKGTLTVASGQNWNTIAAKSGDTLAQLRALNGPLDALKAGQKIKV